MLYEILLALGINVPRLSPTPGRIYRCYAPSRKVCLPPRVSIGDDSIHIYAWPSRGGVIVHDHADGLDLKFLGLDRVDPPEDAKLDDPDAEDAFAQKLLLLGAKWWDNLYRFHSLYDGAETDDPNKIRQLAEMDPPATVRERRWVSVGWPSGGGVVVAEFETMIPGFEDDDDKLKPDTSRLRLATTMDERCEILQKNFDAKFYQSVEEYDGFAFLNSWAWKETGEVGALEMRPQ